jgi:3-hydroxyisobutyrate dehydrogenase-like beta-hydroxyacid dehydrogenase
MHRGKRIGFVGLGLMGAGMAMNIVRKHGQLNVYDIDGTAVQTLVEAGAAAMSSPQELAAASDLILLSLPSPAISRHVVLGEGGLAHGLTAGTTVIGLSTDGIEAIREIADALAEKDVRFVDCPVGKGPTAAAAGDLTLFASGDQPTCEEVGWVLAMIGSKTYYCGLLGSGQAIKLANNLLSCGYAALISEAYAMAKQAGADMDVFCEALPQTAANSWPLENVFIAKAFKGDFSPYFRLSAAHKDYKLIVAMATALGTSSRAAQAVLEYYAAAAAAGHSGRDFGALALVNNPELLRD